MKYIKIFFLLFFSFTAQGNSHPICQKENQGRPLQEMLNLAFPHSSQNDCSQPILNLNQYALELLTQWPTKLDELRSSSSPGRVVLDLLDGSTFLVLVKKASGEIEYITVCEELSFPWFKGTNEKKEVMAVNLHSKSHGKNITHESISQMGIPQRLAIATQLDDQLEEIRKKALTPAFIESENIIFDREGRPSVSHFALKEAQETEKVEKTFARFFIDLFKTKESVSFNEYLEDRLKPFSIDPDTPLTLQKALKRGVEEILANQQ